MTKAQIVSHFAGKFELSKKTSAMIIEEVAGLAIAETKKIGAFTVPGILFGESSADGEIDRCPHKHS
jgi:hypothetical protein